MRESLGNLIAVLLTVAGCAASFQAIESECSNNVDACRERCNGRNDYCLAWALERLNGQGESPPDIGDIDVHVLERGCEKGIERACEGVRKYREQEAVELEENGAIVKDMLANLKKEMVDAIGRYYGLNQLGWSPPAATMQELEGLLWKPADMAARLIMGTQFDYERSWNLRSVFPEVTPERISEIASNEQFRADLKPRVVQIGELLAPYYVRITEIETSLRDQEKEATWQRRRDQEHRIALAEAAAETGRRYQEEQRLQEVAARSLIPQIPQLLQTCERQRNAFEHWKRSAMEEAQRMARRREPFTEEYRERVERRRNEVGDPWSETLEKLRVAVIAKTNGQGSEYRRLMLRVQANCIVRF